jgi:hypothetical protein
MGAGNSSEAFATNIGIADIFVFLYILEKLCIAPESIKRVFKERFIDTLFNTAFTATVEFK